MPAFLRWTFGLTIAGLLTLVPYVYYRASYSHGKRLRVVDPGKVYRSGQLTAEGFEEAIQRYGIRTVLNLQDEYPDPDLLESYFDRDTIKETELCRQLGVHYVFLPPDLIPRRFIPEQRPAAIDQFLAIADDPANYPMLIHCRAGLHRTGCLVAVYRMEYDGYSPAQAIREMKDNGFGEWPCTSANDYIRQYVLTYRPGVRGPSSVVRGP